MRIFIERIAGGDAAPSTDTLTLPFATRRRSRFRAVLDSGEQVGVMLGRGTALREGDCLVDERGQTVVIRAAGESVSTVRTADPVALARACYHLGNRHVPLQIAGGWARYQHDHVLDDMVRALGVAVTVEKAAFEPERGAYDDDRSGQYNHHHSHDHGRGEHT
jgi:urease accessory protein